MPAPFDYTLNVQSPVDAMFTGFALGDQRRANAQQLAMGEQTMGLRAAQEGRDQQAFDLSLQDRQMALAEAEQERAQTEAMNAEFAALSQKIAGGQYGVQDFAALAAKYPELSDELAKTWEGVSVERKSNDVANLARGITALKVGRPDIAIQMLEERAKAAENGGDKMEADMSRAMIANIKVDPNSAMAALGVMLNVVDPDAAATVLGQAPEKPAGVVELEWRAKEAGLEPGTPEYQQFIARDGKPVPASGTTTINPDGSVVVSRSADGTPKAGVSLAEVQTSVDEAVSMIDDIANDPVLPKVTGSIEGGGGNDVREFNMAQRVYYGDRGLSLIQKIYQLQNTAWLAARDLLKGGGQITDYESRKAEGAMSRLERPQGTAEYKAALQDLRDAITDGVAKLKAAGMPVGDNSSSQPPVGQAAPVTFEDAFSKYGLVP